MSKFDKVFEAREDQEKESKKAVVKNNSVKNSAVKSSTAKNKTSKSAGDNNSSGAESLSETPVETVASESPKPEKQRGRPKAKRSDPAFIGFTTYIRKDTHLKVKIALLQEGKGREMSELVEDLLSSWTKNK